jgi:hypothetical protein
MKLENWALVDRPCDGLHFFAIHGTVYGNSKFADGEVITTSSIVDAFIENNVIQIQTRHNLYELGIIDPEYDKAYPNALERMKQSILKNFNKEK